MLSIRAGPDVPPALVDLLVHHARPVGLSLGALEVLGGSLDAAEAFIVAAEEGRAVDHARGLGLLPPEERVALARWQAEKIFR